MEGENKITVESRGEGDENFFCKICSKTKWKLLYDLRNFFLKQKCKKNQEKYTHIFNIYAYVSLKHKSYLDID